MMRRTILITVALALGLSGSARAEDTMITGSLVPNTPGAGSALHVAIGGAAPELGGALPDAITLGLQRGFKLDLKSVAARCDAVHAPTADCPAASRIGSGQALAHASGLINTDIPATLDVFLAQSVQAGDLASVVLRLTFGNQTKAIQARLRAVATGPVGYELSVAGFAASIPSFPGLTFSLKSLTLDIGAARKIRETVKKRVRVTRHGKRVTITRKVRRTVRHDLIRNPKTCPGAWGARVTVRIAGTDRVRDLAVPCAAA
jgi:hypothetical protein